MTYSVDQLQHFGVKGMRWGVRKTEPSGKVTRSEKKHIKKATSNKGYVRVHNAAARQMNNVEIPRINKKPEYKNADFTNDSPLRRKYYKEYETTLQKVMVDNFNKEFGTAPTGRKLKFSAGKEGELRYDWDDVSHAEGDDVYLVAKTDSRDHIVSIEIRGVMEQSENVDDILEHFGVKGMKWGVRTDRPSARKIHTARRKVGAQREAIKDQKKRVKDAAKGSTSRRSAEKKLSSMKASFLKNPDRATAARLTRGEFWTVQALGAAGTVATGVALPVLGAAGVTYGAYARRKRIEKQVRR